MKCIFLKWSNGFWCTKEVYLTSCYFGLKDCVCNNLIFFSLVFMLKIGMKIKTLISTYLAINWEKPLGNSQHYTGVTDHQGLLSSPFFFARPHTILGNSNFMLEQTLLESTALHWNKFGGTRWWIWPSIIPLWLMHRLFVTNWWYNLA